MKDIPAILTTVKDFFEQLIPFIVGLTLIFFMFGVFRLVRKGSEDDRKQGKQIIAFGIVALFVMVSVWGLVNVISESVDMKKDDTSRAPQGPGVPKFK